MTGERCAVCLKQARRDVWFALFGGPGRTYKMCDSHAAALQGAGLKSIIDGLELRLESRICGICGSPAEGFIARPVRVVGESVLTASFLCGPCIARRDIDKRLFEAASQR
ncbi:MAG: hypothetical protein GEU28_06300 [Dehalococcoidia bacterium]|nr:hypothetical protein [Dehalococcoidia bacterium]